VESVEIDVGYFKVNIAFNGEPMEPMVNIVWN